MIVSCDECKNEFELKLLTEKVEDDCEKVYFDCPHCNKKYITHYTNDKIKKKQARLRKAISDYNEARGLDPKNAKSLYKKYQKLKNEIIKDIETLRR